MSQPQVYYYLKDQSFTEQQQTAINLILRRIEDVVFGLQAGGGTLSGIALLGKLTSNLTLNTTFTNVAGMKVDLTRTGLWLMTAVINMSVSHLDTFPQAQLVCANKAQLGTPVLTSTLGANDQIYAMGQWLFTSLSGTEQCTIQGKKTGGAGTSAIVGYSTLTALWIHP